MWNVSLRRSTSATKEQGVLGRRFPHQFPVLRAKNGGYMVETTRVDVDFDKETCMHVDVAYEHISMLIFIYSTSMTMYRFQLFNDP